jgi:alpha-1,3-mannosyltransferase
MAIATGASGVAERMICGVRISSGAPADCIAAIDDGVADHKVCLGFVNTFTAYLLRKSEPYRAVLGRFTLLNDGVGLDIVSLIKYGRRFGFNLNGTDFTPRYLRETRHRYRIYLLGGRPGIAAQAATVLQRMAPQHEYVGARDGYFPAEENEAVIADITASRASLVIVALGNPQQELWIANNIDKTGADLAIGVGALFDFLADAVPRAPLWMRRLKLEWLFRMAHEPRRLWKRYMIFTPTLILLELAEKTGFL